MFEEIRIIVRDTLQLGERADSMTASTELLGNLPELDSMAVVVLITSIEEEYGFVVDDDEISADTFATLGSLVEFVRIKLENS